MPDINFIRWTTLGGLALLFTACGKPPEDAATPGATPVAEAARADPGPHAADPQAAGATATGTGLETMEQQASYGIGYQVGISIGAHEGVAIDFDALTAGIRDGLRGARPRLEQETVEQAFREIERREQAATTARDQANLDAAAAFLAENAKRPGVTTTTSGLQYEVLAAAADPQAARPAPADTVVVHYHGTLIDGTVFDSSIQRGAPIKLAVGEVIPGWTEALQRMATGDKWRIFLPPSLAYRSRKTGSIPANSALIFEVELISIVAPGPADAPGVPPQVP